MPKIITISIVAILILATFLVSLFITTVNYNQDLDRLTTDYEKRIDDLSEIVEQHRGNYSSFVGSWMRLLGNETRSFDYINISSDHKAKVEYVGSVGATVNLSIYNNTFQMNFPISGYRRYTYSFHANNILILSDFDGIYVYIKI